MRSEKNFAGVVTLALLSGLSVLAIAQAGGVRFSSLPADAQSSTAKSLKAQAAGASLVNWRSSPPQMARRMTSLDFLSPSAVTLW
jgi:hypothetical protein